MSTATKPQPRPEASRLGGKVRAFRRKQGLSQVQLAEKLGISGSYLNLIENNRRPLPSPLLIKLAQTFEVDLGAFATDEEARLTSELYEVFADPVFEHTDLASADVRELAASSPPLARAVLSLYRAYQGSRETAESLASRVSDDEQLAGVGATSVPSEDVNDLVQSHENYFDELERAAEALWRAADLDPADLYAGLVRYLEHQHHVTVRIARWADERGTLRRYDPANHVLTLSELLPTRSRNFQLAHQIGLLEHRETFARIVTDPHMASEESRALGRVALANYFAAAVMLPYEPFVRAAREERYDIEVLGRRFRVGFEQVCHRLTTLQRPGAEGVPFHMIRIDVAGNISKRFSASGIRFARYSGACPRWNVFAAFLTPGMIRIQISRMPDGATFFCVARTIQKDSGGYHQQQPVMAIALGCKIEHARELVYSDGIDLEHLETATPVGVTCRMCERTDCDQRAHPSLRHPLKIDENVRGISLYAAVTKR